MYPRWTSTLLEDGLDYEVSAYQSLDIVVVHLRPCLNRARRSGPEQWPYNREIQP